MKTAPVQGVRRLSIPPRRIAWDLHVRAWQVYAAIGHGSQSAQRIAERGGFGPVELLNLLAELNLKGEPLHPGQQDRLERLRAEGAEE